MTQSELFARGNYGEEKPRAAAPAPAQVMTAEDKERFAGQLEKIVTRLRAGPATNDELAAISRKYTSRISDLRKLGLTIECERLEGGLTKYTLKEP